MTIEEIKANQELMTTILADQEITSKVKDNLVQSGFKVLTDTELATLSKQQIDQAVRQNHELVEAGVFEASGIEKPANTKSDAYAKLVAQQLKQQNIELQQKLAELQEKQENPKPKDKVAEQIENQEIATLKQQIEALQKVNQETEQKAFNAQISAEITSLDLILPKAIEAQFKVEHTLVEHEGRKIWKDNETGQFMLNNESAAPMSVSDIIKQKYTDAFKKEQEKRPGLDISRDKNVSQDSKNDYTVSEAILLLAKRGITKTDSQYQGLLKQMTANSPEFKK